MHVRLWFVRLAVLAAVFGGVFPGAGPIQGQKKEEAKDKTGILARTRSALGTLFASEKDVGPCVLELYSDIREGTRLFSPPGQRGVLAIKEGDLLLTLVGNLPEISPSPVLEAAVKLTSGKESDVAVTLEQGILLIEAGKDSAGGKAQVAFRDKHIRVELQKGSAVAFELSSYLPQGTRYSKKAMAEPIGELLFFVLRGRVNVAMDADTEVVTGPLLYGWSTRAGWQEPVALRRYRSGRTRSRLTRRRWPCCRRRRGFAAVRRRMTRPGLWRSKSKDVAERVVGLYHAAALDRTDAILNVLDSDAELKVRQAAVTALRVYVGEGDKHAEKLHQTLIENKFKAGQAGIFLHLLLGFNAEDRNRRRPTNRSSGTCSMTPRRSGNWPRINSSGWCLRERT